MNHHGDPIPSGSSNPPRAAAPPHELPRSRPCVDRQDRGEGPVLAALAKQDQAWVRGQGEFEPLARAGQAVLLPLPNSGTAQRSEALHHMQLAGLLGAGGELLSGSLLGGVAGLAAPAAVGRTLLSRPVQGYLGNQAAASAPRLLDTPQGQYMRVRGLLNATDDREGDHMR
jgi:hypothetical protein